MEEPAPDAADGDDRDAYHHGRLREALLDAAVDAARTGGAEAIVLRELTRRVGVTPRAAYRHFDGVQALVEAVADVALHELAQRVVDRVAAAQPRDDDGAAAIATLHVIGEEYVAYARREPGMFDVTFFARGEMADREARHDDRPTAYGLLTETVRAIAHAGRLRVPEPLAVLSCWSAVHGLASLTVRGPLRSMPETEVRDVTAGVVAAAVTGVVSEAPG